MGSGACLKPHSLFPKNALFSSDLIWGYQNVSLLVLTQDPSEKEFISGLIKQKGSIMFKMENKKF